MENSNDPPKTKQPENNSGFRNWLKNLPLIGKIAKPDVYTSGTNSPSQAELPKANSAENKDKEGLRQEVGDEVRQFFMNIDAKVAQAMGVKGSILEQLIQARAVGNLSGRMEIESGKLDPKILEGFYNSKGSEVQDMNSRFNYLYYDTATGKRISYLIEGCGEDPRIIVGDANESFTLDAYAKDFSNYRFEERHESRDGEGGLHVQKTKIETFPINSGKGMIQFQERSRGEAYPETGAYISYSLPNDAGDVTIQDGSNIDYMESNKRFSGSFSQSENSVTWKGQEPKLQDTGTSATMVDPETNVLQISSFFYSSNLVFPIQDNIKDVTVDMIRKMNNSSPIKAFPALIPTPIESGGVV